MMHFRFDHNNINVLDLDKSLAFYQKAFGFQVLRRKDAPDGSFILVFLGDGGGTHRLELTWLRDRTEPYNLGDNEFHLALRTDDYEAAHALHQDMGCIVYENPGMGLYFVEDPDGYWIEILPKAGMILDRPAHWVHGREEGQALFIAIQRIIECIIQAPFQLCRQSE